MLAMIDGPLGPELCQPSQLCSHEHGAIASFLGVVRNSHHGKGVSHLIYDSHRSLASAELSRIANKLCETCGENLGIALVHGLGHMVPGQISLAIHISSAHRSAAFDACRLALEWIKHDLAVWKHEFYQDGSSQWLHGS